ncbi:MAG: NUDIX domain-containing protein [Phycisphaerales bacterium]|nr:NUDIX domain-containing protein [Phycisphaerales bacterium]
MTDPTDLSGSDLPYRIAVLCYLRDAQGRQLMLHRAKPPNSGLYSPIGGKLEPATGESPHQCAVREIFEETGLQLQVSDVRLAGMVAETAYEGAGHWLLFLFDVTRTIGHDEIQDMEFDEGTMEWIEMERIADLPLPETDRSIIWPLVRRHQDGFFSCHIDCRNDPMTWTLDESTESVAR